MFQGRALRTGVVVENGSSSGRSRLLNGRTPTILVVCAIMSCSFNGAPSSTDSPDAALQADASQPDGGEADGAVATFACTQDGSYLRDPQTGIRLKLIETPEVWSEQLCANDGAFLAKLDSQEKRDFAARFNLTSARTSVGLSDLDTEGDWRWLDGTPVDLVLGWRSGTPDGQPDGTEDCGAIDIAGRFDDQQCGGSRDYLCECPN